MAFQMVYEVANVTDKEHAFVSAVLKEQFTHYKNLTEQDLKRVNVTLAYTKNQGLAAQAIKLKDDMRKAIELWESFN
jgi:hypothetical protein